MNKVTQYAIGASVLVIAGLIIWVVILQGQKEEAILRNSAFKVQAERAQKNVETLREQYKVLKTDSEELSREKEELLELLNRTPTDEQVIIDNDIRLLDANSNWGEIERSIHLSFKDSTDKP